jgi:hypothetical protein
VAVTLLTGPPYADDTAPDEVNLHCDDAAVAPSAADVVDPAGAFVVAPAGGLELTPAVDCAAFEPAPDELLVLAPLRLPLAAELPEDLALLWPEEQPPSSIAVAIRTESAPAMRTARICMKTSP